jgi:hypothetical protein
MHAILTTYDLGLQIELNDYAKILETWETETGRGKPRLVWWWYNVGWGLLRGIIFVNFMFETGLERVRGTSEFQLGSRRMGGGVGIIALSRR